MGASEAGIEWLIAFRRPFSLRWRIWCGGWIRHTTSWIDVDPTFGELPFGRAAVANCENHDVGGIRVRLPRVEDLLVMKAIARRPKDVEDLQGLLAAHPELDVTSARRWVREFAIAMSMPDMLREFDALLAQRPPQG